MLGPLRSRARMPLRFLLVGALGALINIMIYATLVHVAQVAPLPASVAAFSVAVSHNYLLNRSWTFRARRRGLVDQGARFLVVSLLALGVNLAVLALLLDAAVPKVPAEVLAIGVAAPVSFLANRHWAFRPALGHA